MSQDKKGIFERLKHLDTRALYAVSLIIIAWMYFAPVSVPIPVSDYTRTFHKAVEALPSGAVVVLTSDFSARQSPESYPGLLAITEHLLSKNVKIVATTLNMQGYLFIENAFKERNAWGRKKYGVDFVNLGWLPGERSGVASFAKDIRSVFKRDQYGTPIDDLPLMKTVNSYQDFALIVEVFADQPGIECWVDQLTTRYKTPMIYFDIQSHLTQQLYWLNSGAVQAILSGLRGTAEYEYLQQKPLQATRSMSTQTILGVLIIFCIVMANVNYFGAKYGRRN